MWALQAWGELALGLAAPRAAHVVGSDYSNQTLAWDVVRQTVTFEGRGWVPGSWWGVASYIFRWGFY